ncbi:MAG: (2Fe-2S)-binding protein [Deltaproteobacteria bacterium]|nr:(2Fe-2S)-binding protein [Deltaproteobacteria bacterium]
MADEVLTIDGREVVFEEGETVLEAARRAGASIPTLCNDDRLAPVGACRTCLVEVEGSRRLVPSCTAEAKGGMVVVTESERVKRHQQTLFALYLTDNVAEEETHDTAEASELHRLAHEVRAPIDWPRMAPLRAERKQDRNPYIEFRADRCILCARCTRYCDEVEGVQAISLTGRGAETTISTSDQMSLLDSSCELCGGCIEVCPTGAMTEKMPLTAMLRKKDELELVRTTCNYCGVGCQMDLNVDKSAKGGRGKVVKVSSPPPGTLPNDGNLCVKGRFAYQFIDDDDRLTTPLVRAEDGTLQPASWGEAIERAAKGLKQVADRHGADALGFVSSSRCTMEENYLVQKLSRAAFGTNNCHQCAAT